MRLGASLVLLALFAAAAPAMAAAERGAQGTADLAASDLRTSLLHRGNETAIGDSVGFSWTITNLGPSQVSQFAWRLELDGSTIVESPFSLTLGPGESFPMSWGYWTAAPVGEHRLRVILDPHETLDQPRRDNDIAETDLTITATPRPQLRLERMGLNPVRPVPGDDVVPWVVLGNNGSAPANDFAVEFTLGGLRSLVAVNESLEPGAVRNVTGPPSRASQGLLGFDVHYDAFDELVEHHEAGNRASTSVLVDDPAGRPDMAVIDLRPYGRGSSFQGVITNRGTGAARDYTLVFSVDGVEQWRRSGVHEAFPAGFVYHDGTIEWPRAAPGRHNATLRVIAGDAELNPSDDARSVEFEYNGGCIEPLDGSTTIVPCEPTMEHGDRWGSQSTVPVPAALATFAVLAAALLCRRAT